MLVLVFFLSGGGREMMDGLVISFQSSRTDLQILKLFRFYSKNTGLDRPFGLKVSQELVINYES